MGGVSYTVRLSDLRIPKDLLDRTGGAFGFRRGATRAAARYILDYIISKWPVDTARSLSGWYLRHNGDASYTIGNDVEYAEYVHQGKADRLFMEALPKSSKAARAELQDMLQESKRAPGRRRVRIKRPAAPRLPARVVKDRAVLRAMTREIATLGADQVIKDRVRRLITAGKVEAAIKLLVQNGRRQDAKRLSKHLQTS